MLAKLNQSKNGHTNSDPWPRKLERFPVIPDDQGRCWHAVHSDTKNAPKACEVVKKHGYEVYYPHMCRMQKPPLRKITLSKRKSLNDIGRPVLTPVFPGYPFVLFSIRDGKWRDLFNLFGVYGMIVAEGLPVPVPSQVVSNIKDAEIGGVIPLETPVTKLLFRAGEEVRIDDGPLRGFNGTIQDLDEAKRIVLLDVIMFGASRSVPFDPDQLSKT